MTRAYDYPFRMASIRAHALIGRRLLALLYDFFPVAALWFATAAVALFLRGGQPVRADTLAGWSEGIVLWLVTGLYATASWRLGGQTLGMRPWRLHVVADPQGMPPGWRAAWLRFVVGTVSLFAGGAGFWWAWIDRERLTWHDRVSATRLIRRAPAT
ncbi:MAG: RDD family protein [Lysobacter sp.]|nr:MAG: RDD family protein [Lysobacter sp.]